jgi:phosphoglycerate dehydrogenase-like enzyme
VSPSSLPSSSDVVVLCEHRGALEPIRSRFPSVDVVDISGGIPPGTRGDVLFGGGRARSVEAMATGVRWVQLIGTGTDQLPSEVRAAPVLTTPRGASAVAISEYVIATMGAFARNFPANWLNEAPESWFIQPAGTLAGKTLGLFGFGGIAQRVARIALAMDMKVTALRRQVAPSPVAGVEIVGDIPDLFSVADHLVLAAPATDATFHVVNTDSLRLLRPGAHLVNIARGSLVDQEALRGALDDGTVARASLDVTDPEPLPAGHWLFSHPQVFLTPHASWAGPPMFEAATVLFCDNLARFLNGEPLDGTVGSEGY